MRAVDAIRRSGVGVEPDVTIRDAAIVMERAGVGALVVLGGTAPVGVVTDRDLVRRGMAKGLLPDARVDAVMSAPVITLEADADLHRAFALFRSHAVRRLAVVDGERFVGMITIDDLLMNLAGDLMDLARPVMAEVLFAHHDSPLPTRP